MPAAPSAPPPSKPAAAPAAPSAPKAPPSPPPSKTGAPPVPPQTEAAKDYMAEYDSELDGLDDNKPKPAQKPKEKKTEALVKPPEGAEKPAEDAKDPAEELEAKTSNPEDEKPTGIPELRKNRDALAKMIKSELRPALDKANARIAELEKNGDVKVWSDRASAAEKRAAELDGQMRFVDYSRSDEFNQKFAQPFAQAWNRALSDFGQLKVRVPAGVDEATGEPQFNFRAADQNDLIKLANLSLSEMDDAAEAMFGKSAARVIRHVERVRELSEAQEKALEYARKNAGEYQKTTQAEQRRQREEGVRMWHESHKALLEKYPKFFGKDESDPEGNALLDKGTAEAESIFNRTKENQPKTAEEAVKRHALAYHKIANHDRLAKRLKTARARIEELEKAVKEFEESGPPAGNGGQPGDRSGSNGWSLDSEFAEIDKLNTR